jgi:hypothetical protein
LRELYLIMHCSGSYDDYSEVPVLASFDKTLLNAKVEELNTRKVARDAAYSAINQHMTSWEQTSPRPRSANIKDDPLPTFPGKKFNWTTEQKAKLKTAKEANQKKRLDTGCPFSGWIANRFVELTRYTETLDVQIQEDLKEMSSDSSWGIESVPYIE